MDDWRWKAVMVLAALVIFLIGMTQDEEGKDK